MKYLGLDPHHHDLGYEKASLTHEVVKASSNIKANVRVIKYFIVTKIIT